MGNGNLITTTQQVIKETLATL